LFLTFPVKRPLNLSGLGSFGLPAETAQKCAAFLVGFIEVKGVVGFGPRIFARFRAATSQNRILLSIGGHRIPLLLPIRSETSFYVLA
jgi:hypothetical protein